MEQRKPASVGEKIEFGSIDASKSLLKKIPAEHEQVFHLELRSKDNRLVDVAVEDVKLRYQTKSVSFNWRRLSQGRYLLVPQSPLEDVSRGRFSIQNKLLKNSLVSLNKPHRSSQIEILEKNQHELVLRLKLNDKKGRSLASEQKPDIILEGLGEVSDLEPKGAGIWEFRVNYPEENQVFYLSVRLHGVLLEKIFRYQHVEK